MLVIGKIESILRERRGLRGKVGVVLTMGALHQGHLDLVKAAREDNDHVIATIFVNPTQFAANEDFASYPRDLDRDLDLFEKAGVDLVFTPTPEMMYPPGFETHITVEDVSQGLEGQARPGHFRGVATVVNKFFNILQPTTAYFGQKDAQQVVVIRHMVRDLNMPLKISVVPTLREPDGLAMSSRNVYLKPEERAVANVLYRSMRAASAAYEAGDRHPNALRKAARAVLDAEPQVHTDYVAICDPRTLLGVHQPSDRPVLILVAAKLGKPRLLDNCLLPFHLNNRADLSAILGV